LAEVVAQQDLWARRIKRWRLVCMAAGSRFDPFAGCSMPWLDDRIGVSRGGRMRRPCARPRCTGRRRTRATRRSTLGRDDGDDGPPEPAALRERAARHLVSEAAA
jgi:hypothetical protein